MNENNKMINYANEIVEYDGCPGCAYARHEFSLPCGIAYENSRFILSQDWELPIQGFFVLTPKRCVEQLSELSREERIEMFDIVDKTIVTLRENSICDRFNVIFEEKESRHFHIWIMPRHKWMKDIFGSITKNTEKIFDYAKENFRTKDNYNEIIKITKIVKEKFNK